MTRPMRVPGIDPPHRADCIACRRTHEWFGLRPDGGKDTPAGFVCRRCARETRRAAAR